MSAADRDPRPIHRGVSIGIKLAAAFASLLAATLAIGIVSLLGLMQVNREAVSVKDNYLPSVERSSQQAKMLEMWRLDVAKHIMTTEPAELAKVDAVLVSGVADYAKARSEFEPLIDAGQEQGIYVDIDAQIAVYKPLLASLLDLSRQNRKQDAMEMFNGKSHDVFQKIRSLYRDDVRYNMAKGTAAGERGTQTYDQVFWIDTGMMALCVLACVGIYVALVRNIARPVVTLTAAMQRLARSDLAVEIPGVARGDEIGGMANAVEVFKRNALRLRTTQAEAEAHRAAAEAERTGNETERAANAAQQAAVVEAIGGGLEQLANGDLVVRLPTAFAPEYEKLRADFNAAMDRLQESMLIVASNTTGIRSGAAEIATAADDLSRRTEQQAASLEETAAALDQITATVKKTSGSATHAHEVVSATKVDAEYSGTVVGRAVAAMTAIETSAQQVSQIIGVIDEIAFQTNLLALNAGVEAARAGEAGRGFAVVASEVRALAQRSAEAAKEIKALISTSSIQVGQGVELVSETGRSLERIVTQVAEMSVIVSAIATSAHEQAAGLDQVNTAVNQMDQVTQQNAAMVEQSTAASHGLAQEADTLAQLIGRFQLGLEASRGAKAVPSGVVSRGPAAMLKTTGRGGAVRQPVSEPAVVGWEEF